MPVGRWELAVAFPAPDSLAVPVNAIGELSAIVPAVKFLIGLACAFFDHSSSPFVGRDRSARYVLR